MLQIKYYIKTSEIPGKLSRVNMIFVEQKVSRGKLSFFAYIISGEQSTNWPKQLRNDAFHVKTSQSAKN